MNTFRTPIEPNQYPFSINHNHNICFLGSCFSQHIGEKMQAHKFNTTINPFGVVFHPLTIVNTVQTALSNKIESFNESVISRDGLFFSYQYHSSIYGHTPEELQQKILSLNQGFLETWMDSDIIFITLGSSIGHVLKANNTLTGNCHKQPSSLFNKIMTSQQEISASLGQLIQAYPSKKFIFTVSPVRHTKEGLTQNSASKAILRACCQLLETTYDHAFYFPSFEIMMDDLRDYRFYKKDYIHPSEEAIDYIWNYFKRSLFSSNTSLLCDNIQQLQRDLAHKPFHPSSKNHLTFLQKTLEQAKALNNTVDLSSEINTLNNMIIQNAK